MIGRSLGHYVIVSKIGKGGMGEVYLANDTHLEREVAIKILSPGSVIDARIAGRFRREALSLSQLNHPNIATVHDFATAGDLDYLVMEYIPGDNLGDLMAHGPLDHVTTVGLARQLAAGLMAAHRVGVIHRDLKPGNVRVTPDGRLKILDFGLAHQIRRAGANLATATATAPGTLLGTPAYMSPEQLRGEPVGEASDLFSLGVVLYQMATGEHPFAAPSVESQTYKIVHEEPVPLSRVRSKVSAEFARLVQELLHKDPKKRPRSAADVLRRLGEDSSTATVRTWRRQPRLPVRVALPAALVVVAAACVLYFRGPSEAYATKAGEGILRRLTVTSHAGLPSWSPDGRHIAYWDRDDRRSVYFIRPDGVEAGRVAMPCPVVIPWGWMPDSRAALAYGVDEHSGKWTVYRVGLDSSVTALADNAYFGDVSPDGRTMAFVEPDPHGATAISVLDLSTGARKKLIESSGPGTANYKPKWAPDGRRLSYIRWNGRGHEIWVANSDATDDHQIDTGPILVGGNYDWTPDGRALVIGGDLHGLWSIWRVPVSGRDLHQYTISTVEEAHVGVAPDGQRFVFQRSEDLSRIGIFDVQTGACDFPFEIGTGARQPSFSPDGKTLYFHSLVNGRWQIWCARLTAAARPRPLVQLGAISAFSPAVDAQGRVMHLRARVGRNGRFGRIEWSQTLWSVGPAGEGELQLLPGQERIERLAPGSQLSSSLLFTTNTPRNQEALLVQRPGDLPFEVFEDNPERSVSAFDWGRSPMEVLLALRVEGNPEYSWAISALNTQSSELTHLATWGGKDRRTMEFGNISAMALSPDRRHLALIGAGDTPGTRAIHLLDLEGSSSRILHEFDAKDAPGTIAWSHDGQHLAVELGIIAADLFIWEPQTSDLDATVQ